MSGAAKDPLHGVTLEMILKKLVDQVGWKAMARRIEVRCFMFDPSIPSSLKFLRRTPWARAEVERLYLECVFGAHRRNSSAPPERTGGVAR